jgi:hypothetical protein
MLSLMVVSISLLFLTFKLNHTSVLETKLQGAQLNPTVQTLSLVDMHPFHKLTNLSFSSDLKLDDCFWQCEHPSGFDAFLDLTPSLQKILLPIGHFPSDLDKTPVDQLAKKLLEQPSFCPNLQDIGSPEYPTDWVAFLQMLTSRCLRSLLSSTGYPKSIHTLHFHVLPHPQIIQQMEDAMSGKLLSYYFIPLCEEGCKYLQEIQDLEAQTHPETKVCIVDAWKVAG